LPPKCEHKLGLGKPLGLGSIKIKIEKLNVVDRKNRYTKLFDSNGYWNLAQNEEVGKIDEYKSKFENYMLSNLNNDEKLDNQGKNVHSLWETKRLKELKTMLTLEDDMTGANVSWLDKTRYMEINHEVYKNEFKHKPVLPYPSEVANKNIYKKE